MVKLSWLEFNIVLNCQYPLQTILLDKYSNELTDKKNKNYTDLFLLPFYPPKIKYT